MTVADVQDFVALKKGGFIRQRQDGVFSVRLRVLGGSITTEQLARLEKVARRYGRGFIHLTSRQAVEIPWVSPESFDQVKAELAEVDLFLAGAGPKVRSVMTCVGNVSCARAVADALGLAKEIDARFFGQELPVKKLKIAISGCPNSCTTPQINDIGVIGIREPSLNAELCTGCALCVDACRESAIAVGGLLASRDPDKCVLCGDCAAACPEEAWQARRTGYALYVGGKAGRHPQFGIKIAEFLSEDEVVEKIERIGSFLRKHGSPKIRFGALLNTLGHDALLEHLGL